MLSTPYRTNRELFWIKELGTAMPYGCNNNIKGVGNLSSPGCNEINVLSLFNTIPRTKRNQGHKRIQHPNVAHPTSQCLTSFTNIQKSTECTCYAVNDIFSETMQIIYMPDNKLAGFVLPNF
jgi:hypothetical protein